LRPTAIVALGATAARSVLGHAVSGLRTRGRAQPLPDGAAALVTIHPSFLLRIKNAAEKKREYRRFVADLRRARRLLAATGPA
jgi:uracil-DNA glycosylase